MLTATKDLLLPTTVTGSWPRPVLVHRQPLRAPVLVRDGRRRLPGAVRRRGRLRALRPGSRRARHPHERRLPPGRRRRRPLVVLLPVGAVRRACRGTTARRRSAGRTRSARGSTRSSAAWKYHAVVDKVGPRVAARVREDLADRAGPHREAREVRDDRRRPRRDRAHGQDGRLRAGQAGPDVGHRDDPERRAARAPGGGLQGDPDRGAGDPQRGRLRRARGVPRLPRRPVQPHGRGPRRRRALDPHLLGQPGRAALLRPADLLRAVGRHLPEPPQGRRLDDRVARRTTTACCRPSRRTRATCRRRSRSA